MSLGNTLFISDLDGTLLGSDSKVSSQSARLISELSQKGVLVTVATARTPATVEPLLASTITIPPAIVMTGAALWDRTTRRYVDTTYIPEEEIAPLIKLFSQADISPFFYTLPTLGENAEKMKVFHHKEMNEAENKFFIERKNLTLKEFQFIESPFQHHFKNIILIYAIGNSDKIESLAEKIKSNCRLSVSCYRDIFSPDIANIEIFGAGVSKAAAVKRLASMMNANRLIVYGDNLNDIPMFEVADEAVAVANALPEVKKAASRTIGFNYDDAVVIDIVEKCEEKC